MSLYLVDSNVLLRYLDTTAAAYQTAVKTVNELISQGHRLHIAPQNIIEFWAVASRPIEKNGFGWDVARCHRSLPLLLASFVLLPDTTGVFDEWQRLVVAYSVTGLHVHDTRLVAVMKAHGVESLLTFNAKHFRRFEAGENIVVVEPTNI